MANKSDETYARAFNNGFVIGMLGTETDKTFLSVTKSLRNLNTQNSFIQGLTDGFELGLEKRKERAKSPEKKTEELNLLSKKGKTRDKGLSR